MQKKSGVICATHEGVALASDLDVPEGARPFPRCCNMLRLPRRAAFDQGA
jgi:hypothetical protein